MMTWIRGYWIYGDKFDKKDASDQKVFIKTFKQAEKILETHTHIDAQRIRCQYLKSTFVHFSELGTCKIRTRYLGKNVYVTRSLNTCSVCYDGNVKTCGECDGFIPEAGESAEICPICGYLNSKPMITEEGYIYEEHDEKYSVRSKTKNTNHCFCPKCWGIHDRVTRKIIRHKDGFMVPVIINHKFRSPQDQYSWIYDPDKDPEKAGGNL